METSQPSISLNEEAKNYFTSKSEDDETPLVLNIPTQIRYYNLENFYNSFYPIDSLTIAKDFSKKEREEKQILDPTFTYSETVCKIFF